MTVQDIRKVEAMTDEQIRTEMRALSLTLGKALGLHGRTATANRIADRMDDLDAELTRRWMRVRATAQSAQLDAAEGQGRR